MKKLIPFNFQKWESLRLPIVNGRGEKVRIAWKTRECVTYPVYAFVNDVQLKSYTEFGRYIQYHTSDEDLFMVANFYFVKSSDIFWNVKNHENRKHK